MTDSINIRKTIQERYAKLPKEVQLAVTDVDLVSKMKSIAAKHSLMLDQIGSLQTEILFVMLGMEPSSEFINNITDELGIDNKKAIQIAQDVNELIFSPIRVSLRKFQEEAEEEITSEEADHSDLEQAGNFTIEKSALPNTAGEHDAHLDTEAILAEIENPTTGVIKGRTIDPMIDHLLANPVVAVEQKNKPNSQPVEKASTIPANLPVQAPKNDGYREQI